MHALEYIAGQVDPIWGIIAVVCAGIAILAIILQMVVVKKSEWDKHAQIALEDEKMSSNNTLPESFFENES